MYLRRLLEVLAATGFSPEEVLRGKRPPGRVRDCPNLEMPSVIT